MIEMAMDKFINSTSHRGQMLIGDRTTNSAFQPFFGLPEGITTDTPAFQPDLPDCEDSPQISPSMPHHNIVQDEQD